MYIPAAFEVQDANRLGRFMRDNSFATLITHSDQAGASASHVPVLYDAQPHPGVLVGHLARANPQWRQLQNGREALVIFLGPHAYVSPRWYSTEPSVPTWNYAAVHAYGIPKVIMDEASLAGLVRRMIRVYEGEGEGAWPGDLPPGYLSRQLKAIVGFEIGITRLEGKFKLGQNRSKSDIAGAYAALSQSAQPTERSLAEFMKLEGLLHDDQDQTK